MASVSKAGFSSDDESGWTTYFDDFFNNHKSSSISSFVNSSSSLVSDATSFNLAAKKVTYGDDDDDDDRTRDEEFSVNKNVISCRRSNFRKRKKPQAVNNLIIHDVLQDTATSPLKKKGSRSSDRKDMGLKAGRHST